jgi:exodeoxyribonuclease III
MDAAAFNDMNIISWNINGIRAIVQKGFKTFLIKYKPEILLLQETKISDTARDKVKFDFGDYAEYWNSGERPGYSGTAVLLRKDFLSAQKEKAVIVKNGIGKNVFDIEGRVQTIELEKLFIVNAYFPNANHELSRLSYKISFNSAILGYIRFLERSKPVIIGGDFNVAHNDIDLANPKQNQGNAGFTDEERNWVDKLVKTGYIDTYRYFNKSRIQYSWWSYRFNARARNIGWRIDYFFASKSALELINNSIVDDSTHGSDHCPVGIIL